MPGLCLLEGGKACCGELATQGRLALIEQVDQTGQVSWSVAGDSSSRVPHGSNTKLASDADNPESEGGGLAFTSSNLAKWVV